MSVPRPVLLVLALLALPGFPGGATPCSPAFDDLAVEVDYRAHLVLYPDSPAEVAEKKGLARVQRVLKKKSPSYRRDAAGAAVVGETLLALYPGQSIIENLVTDALDGLRADLEREMDDLNLTADQLSFGPLRDHALEGAQYAAAALAEHDGTDPLDAGARAAWLEEAAKAMEKGFRKALPGRDGKRRRTCGDEMWVEQDGGLLWRADKVSASYQGSTDMFVLSGIRSRNPADDSELELTANGVAGVGTYPLDFGTGLWRDGPFLQFGVVENGTVTITSLDKVNGTAEGTFAFTARGCLFDCATYEVTGGVFRIRNLLLP